MNYRPGNRPFGRTDGGMMNTLAGSCHVEGMVCRENLQRGFVTFTR